MMLTLHIFCCHASWLTVAGVIIWARLKERKSKVPVGAERNKAWGELSASVDFWSSSVNLWSINKLACFHWLEFICHGSAPGTRSTTCDKKRVASLEPA
ncbi:MAG: hypothetical protein CL912_11930 [Deltaproteobacteria bacterium]|nr:hypothetical protein [Deltaproteobacteria bacterium]